MSIEDYTRLGGDFSEPFDLKTIKALLDTKDTIGAVPLWQDSCHP
ncbi:hypothetical protein [Psychrobacter fulvigenes]|nr:hypothetical protein [Psychrobacter fulvigenes]